MDKSSMTALMAAFAVAYHNERSENPVFCDKLIRSFISDAEYESIKGYLLSGWDFFAPDDMERPDDAAALDWIVNHQLAPTPLARCAFNLDALKVAVMSGASQYVILGAGLDSFAWREKELLTNLTVFELDHPKTQADKLERVSRAGLDVPANLRLVPVDLENDDIKAALMESGFDISRKTHFSLLGVSYYLTRESLAAILDKLGSICAEGSSISFDCPDGGLFCSKTRRVVNMLQMAAAGGERMRFSADEFELMSLLEPSHFLIYEYLNPEMVQLSCFDQRDDGLTAFEHIALVTAVLKGAQELNTKEKIIQTSLALFAKYGFEAVSVSDIAQCLSLSKGALYRHFASKRAILDAIVERMEQTRHEPDANELSAYGEELLSYWTTGFPCRFRRMLTLEQYAKPAMRELYAKYFTTGALARLAERFPALGAQGALEYYSPFPLLYAIFDHDDDRQQVKELFDSLNRRG